MTEQPDGAPTLLFLDTEFTGIEQLRPALISFALVAEDGRASFYAEITHEFWHMKADPWVRQNVVPLLDRRDPLTPDEAGWRLRQWLRGFHNTIRVITDAPDYDWHLIQPLLTPDWPEGLARCAYRFDSQSLGPTERPWVRGLIDQHFTPYTPQHHALHDASALRNAWCMVRESGWEPEWLKRR